MTHLRRVLNLKEMQAYYKEETEMRESIQKNAERLRCIVTACLLLMLSLGIFPGTLLAQQEDEALKGPEDGSTVIQVENSADLGTAGAFTYEGTIANVGEMPKEGTELVEEDDSGIVDPTTVDETDEGAQLDSQAETSGRCGSNLYWSFGNGVLTISGSGAMYDYGNPMMSPWNNYFRSIKAISLPSGLTRIGAFAFQSSGIDSIVIPASVTSIGNCAFRNCTSLKSAVLPSGITQIGSSAFGGCVSLSSITLPKALRTLGVCAFEYCSSLPSIAIPEGIDTIANGVFGGCTSMESIRVPSKVRRIDASAFESCTSLARVELPAGLVTVADYAFNSCNALRDVYFNGTADAWRSVTVGKNNSPLLNASFHYGSQSVFVDVSAWTPHAEDIQWLSSAGISTGWSADYGTTEFRPFANVARADMAAFLFRLAKRWGIVSDSWQPSVSSSFYDVTYSTPHRREILWLYESGISTGWDIGYGRKEFRPYSEVARADMAAFLHRLGKRAGVREAAGGASFADVTYATPHREDVAWLAAVGVSEGWMASGGKREFRPYAAVARADMAAFLHRLDGKR